jgi:hypothetical protein
MFDALGCGFVRAGVGFIVGVCMSMHEYACIRERISACVQVGPWKCLPSLPSHIHDYTAMILMP